jgi:hypothetical protein
LLIVQEVFLGKYYKVKGIYVQQIIELLNLEEWSNDNTEPEEQAD